MKLVYCCECQDVVRVVPSTVRSCECGNVSAKYIDNLNAEFVSKTGDYFLIGFANRSLVGAFSIVESMYEDDKETPGRMGTEFTSFVIPEPCPTFKRVEKFS